MPHSHSEFIMHSSCVNSEQESCAYIFKLINKSNTESL